MIRCPSSRQITIFLSELIKPKTSSIAPISAFSKLSKINPIT